MSKADQHFFEENQEILHYLKNSRVFGNLPGKLLQQLIPLSKFEEYSKGSVILKEGSDNERVHFLIRGVVSIYAGEERILKLQRVGDIIGEMSIISHKPCSASVIAESDVETFSILAKDIGKYSDTHAEPYQNLLYRVFSLILTEKLSLTTHKAQKYESINRKLTEAQTNLRQANEEVETQIKKLRETTVSRDYLDNIMKSMTDMLVVIDRENRIQTANQATLSHLGYDEKELLQKQFTSILINDLTENSELFFEQLHQNGLEYIEKKYRTKEGSEIPVLFSSAVLFKDNGEKQGVVCIAQNIAKIKQMQTQLIQSAKLASLGEMATGMAHELNQPLMTIHLCAEKMLKDLKKQSYEKFSNRLDKILSQVTRAAKIIKHLRTFGGNAKTDHKKAVKINEILENALILLNEQLKLHNIQVIREFSADLPKILGFPLQLEQALINLLINAKDAMELAEEKILTIRTSQLDSTTIVEVEDTGQGVPKHLQHKLFDPFFTTKEIGTGKGLGLSISYGIIQEHGGEIEVISKPGRGTKIRLIFPVS